MSQTPSVDWEELLMFIEDRRVIPVVGAELLTITVDGEVKSLGQHLAGELADALTISRDRLPPDFSLNDVAHGFVQDGGRDKGLGDFTRAMTVA